MSSKRLKKKCYLRITALLSILLVVGAIGMYIYQFGFYISNSKEEWAQFGDFLNVFVGLANLLLISVITLLIYENQKNEEEEKENRIIQKQANERLKFLSHLIQRSIAFTEDFSIRLTEFLKELESEGDAVNIPNLDYPTENDIRMLVEKIAQDEHYFFTYTNILNDSNFLLIMSGFNEILGNYTSYKKSYSISKNQDTIRKKEFYAAMERIITELINRKNISKEKGDLVENISPIEIDIYEKSIKEYFHILKSDESIDLIKFRTKIIRPIAEYLETSKQYLLPKNKLLFDDCLRANRIITEIITLNKKLGPLSEKLKKYNEDTINQIKPKYSKLLDYLNINNILPDYD